ncbi:hypothetical protein B0H13DRAFT_2664456 [Mycena leptocephala]|nr:hypothetical protein B0H13DRAFT_2664456 [Mycena leptocephala]
MINGSVLFATFMAIDSPGAPPLDDDIVDRIMTFCPTFATLQSAILVSKAFHSVFQSHPKSITRAVAYNVIGPALPQALRVVRYPYYDDDGDRRPPVQAKDLDPTHMAATCPEEHSAIVVTAEEKDKLQENSKVVDALENIYSLTQKDRTSKRSVLTPEESWRFRRAAYRIMLYCNIFPGTRYDLDELVDLGKAGVKRIQRQRTAVLNEYPTDELLQVYAVARFMRDVLEVIDEDSADQDVIDTLLATGPDGVVRAWEARSYDDVDDELYWLGTESDTGNTLYIGYFDVPLANIWTARKVKPWKDKPVTKYILDTIVGADDTCSQCATFGGLKLLTEANWHRLIAEPTKFLKGKLKYSPTVTASFSAATSHLHKSDALGPWIAGIFDVKQTPGAWDGWGREMSYCEPCLTKFLEDHVWLWYLNERVQKGWVPPENCWYGYNCKTMVHKRSHVFAKNHLCVPTKGNV